LGVREQRRVARVRGLLVAGGVVRGALVLGRGRSAAPALEQRLGGGEVYFRSARSRGERSHVGAVPARRLLVVLVLPALLRDGVIVARQLLEVGPDQGRHAPIRGLAVHPVKLALDAVAQHELLLRLERERGRSSCCATAS